MTDISKVVEMYSTDIQKRLDEKPKVGDLYISKHDNEIIRLTEQTKPDMFECECIDFDTNTSMPHYKVALQT